MAEEKRRNKKLSITDPMSTSAVLWKTGHIRRSNVSDSRYKEGKKIKEGETPMKQVKARPMTLARKREHEQTMAENDDQPVMEGLYAAHQVEIYRPPRVVDGRIPKNAYGDVDLFVDSMLPEGTVHLPCIPPHRPLLILDRGIAKVAKKLDIDFAEAIVLHYRVQTSRSRLDLSLRSREPYQLLAGLLFLWRMRGW